MTLYLYQKYQKAFADSGIDPFEDAARSERADQAAAVDDIAVDYDDCALFELPEGVIAAVADAGQVETVDDMRVRGRECVCRKCEIIDGGDCVVALGLVELTAALDAVPVQRAGGRTLVVTEEHIADDERGGVVLVEAVCPLVCPERAVAEAEDILAVADE